MPGYDVLLLHASRASVDTVSEYYLRHAPTLTQLNLLDEGVMHYLRDRDWSRAIKRLHRLIRGADAEYGGIRQVLVTCSAIGPFWMKALRASCPMPVIKIDEPMLELAAQNPRVGVVATFPSTVETSVEWLRHFHPGIEIEVSCDADALHALLRGDREEHDRRLISSVRSLAHQNLPAIALAQVSMARLAGDFDGLNGTRILESLSTSLDTIRRLAARNGN